MCPDQTEYLTRIRDHVGSQDPLQLQKEAPNILAELIKHAPSELLKTRPRRDVGEILAHLAEDEVATAWRYRQMVEHSWLWVLHCGVFVKANGRKGCDHFSARFCGLRQLQPCLRW
jgi:hypothetical protein